MAVQMWTGGGERAAELAALDVDPTQAFSVM